MVALEPKPIERLDDFISSELESRFARNEGTVWFVGGAVRDALLGREPREIDLLTSGSAIEFARDIGEVIEEHERFGTVKVRVDDRVFDIAQTRTEHYAAPGALPAVSLGASVEEDLARRDFTINAIAMSRDGQLIEYPGALGDLDDGVLKVLHDKSFTDDATRLWRLVRYSTRLGFKVDKHTSQLATDAVDAGVLDTVSRDRIGAELRLALVEPDPLAALHAAQNLGLTPKLKLDPSEVGKALEILPGGARADLLVLAAVVPDDEWVGELGFTAEELAIVRRCIAAPAAPKSPPSKIADALRDLPDEAAALAGARGNRESAERWLLELRDIKLEITGDDLIASGIPMGPEIGERLQRTLDRKLDGEVSGRDEELAEALK
jgi:tRNA nucleotidyltransferase (CCA-adding enzyme)